MADRIVLNRIEIKEPSDQIVFKLKSRLPEGKILTAAEIDAIGYEFWSVTPVKEKNVPSPGTGSYPGTGR
jgi:hypothetical protein